jgi:phospholipid/cholesterol/gamma-HCH transport system permease protein
MGIIGGMIVGVGMMDLGFMQYFEQTRGAVTLVDCAGGLVKATLYGTIVALAGCLEGMRCGRSAAAVGIATTSAVVKAITYIVVACAVTTVIYHKLGI